MDRNFPKLNGRVHWMGTSGMRWEDFPQTMQHRILFNQGPKAILIHLGGNSITSLKLTQFIETIRKDLTYIISTLPSTKIIWCDILPRLQFRNNLRNDPKVLNKKVRRINRAAHQFFDNFPNNHVITFPTIHESMPELFCRDGVHLSEHGNLIYVQTIYNAISKFM